MFNVFMLQLCTLRTIKSNNLTMDGLDFIQLPLHSILKMQFVLCIELCNAGQKKGYRKKSLDRNPNIDVRVKPYIVQGSLSSRREKMRHVMVTAPMTGKT